MNVEELRAGVWRPSQRVNRGELFVLLSAVCNGPAFKFYMKEYRFRFSFSFIRLCVYSKRTRTVCLIQDTIIPILYIRMLRILLILQTNCEHIDFPIVLYFQVHENGGMCGTGSRGRNGRHGAIGVTVLGASREPVSYCGRHDPIVSYLNSITRTYVS